MKTITILGALTVTALPVNIQANQNVSGFYIGGGIGSTEANLDLDSTSISISTSGSTLKLISGYQFNRIFAIETQYTAYGKVDVPTLYNIDYKWESKTISVASNLGYTFENGLRPFTTIGVSSLDLHQNYNMPYDENVTALRFGAGLEYTPTTLSGVSFRTGYEGDAFTVEDGSPSDVNVIIGSFYVAASYKFK